MDAKGLKELLLSLGLGAQAQKVELLLQLRDVVSGLEPGYYYYDSEKKRWLRRRIVIEELSLPTLPTDSDLSVTVGQGGTFEVKVPRRRPSFIDQDQSE